MNCEDIKKKLKLFLDDLLSDEDFQSFCQHMEECEKCKKYVRSFSSISNQLWKLGQIESPVDLMETIKYKLVHSHIQEKSQSNILKREQFKFIKSFFLVFLLISIVLSFFLYRYFGEKRKKIITEKAEKISISTEILYNNKSSENEYLFDMKDTIPEEKVEFIDKLQEKEKPLFENETYILNSFNEKMATVTYNLHWHIRNDYNKLKECINSAGLILEYEKNNLLIFKTDSQKLKILLEKFASRKIKFLNFSKNIDINLANNEYRVIIFLENRHFPSVHWDIGLTDLGKRKEVLNLIEGNSISINYKADNFIIFSLQMSQLKTLRSKLEIFGLPILEFENIESKNNVLISGPIDVSVFFY
ncbi:MAG: hypothetical protein NC918_04790 [Candidatus Omnitrophica bacterium]|nr:hypothetical protein [Candidatus Omnitrophota bacterium]